MRWSDSELIDAPVDVMWRLTTDVEGWAALMPTITSVQRLDDGPLRVGSRARIKQPGQSAAVWTVTELEPGSLFVWRSARPGLTMTGVHRMTSEQGGCRNTLELEATGLLARPLGLVLGRLFRKVLRTENTCFKAEAERQASLL